MAKPIVMEYRADRERALKALTAVIARLGYTVKGIDNQNGLVTFETGMSLSSWAGQNMSAHVLVFNDSVQITLGGTMKAHGAQVQVYDWGEAGKIATKVFEQLNSILGPAKPVAISAAADSSGGGGALAAVLIIGFIILFVLVMALSQG